MTFDLVLQRKLDFESEFQFHFVLESQFDFKLESQLDFELERKWCKCIILTQIMLHIESLNKALYALLKVC